ncbi:MarR family winged helix-turn-helix transcriptional regulator [Micromonospora sp. NPDC049679]|uniref:MarR family winged helix-turn-helix transcriptional regulator n=1 Tax=Micromonospora sp. NPDC049679 TaxID=3155920 RepID=UPI0033DFB67C
MPERAQSVDVIHAQLNLFARRVRALVNRLHPDLSFVAYTLLAHVHATGGCRAIDLAGYYLLDKSTVSRQVTDLERRGLLDRVVGPGRPTAQILRVTPAGQKKIEAAGRQQRTVLEERFADWSAADLSAFAGYLERFNDEG